jgi:hypothetical protein
LKIAIVIVIIISVGVWLWRLASKELRHNQRVTRGEEPPMVDVTKHDE